MKINIICVGTLQNDFKVIFNKYKKRLEFKNKVNIIEIKEVIDSNIEIKIKKETDLILKAIPKNSRAYLCSLQGDALSSREFSILFHEANITFIIGGSNGVDEKRFDNNFKIKFSNCTFPHQLFRIMLIEQIYRGLSINQNLKYHK